MGNARCADEAVVGVRHVATVAVFDDDGGSIEDRRSSLSRAETVVAPMRSVYRRSMKKAHACEAACNVSATIFRESIQREEHNKLRVALSVPQCSDIE
jgi:ribosomal protein L31E